MRCRCFRPILFVALLALAGCEPRPLPPITVYFSPKGGATDAVVTELNRAERSVRVQAFSFTSMPIAKALLAAHQRGVQVHVLLDSSHRTEKYSEADFLLHEGIPVMIDAKHAIAHNKIMIIDDEVIITGSFNFTNQAERSNAENLLVIRDPFLGRCYTDNWHEHEAHCEPYLGRTPVDDFPDPPPVAAPVPPGQFLSSSNSAVFHRGSCKSAAKISGRNRVLYATRDEALRAGKKPCQECSP